jgi:hypothetical protein
MTAAMERNKSPEYSQKLANSFHRRWKERTGVLIWCLLQQKVPVALSIYCNSNLQNIASAAAFPFLLLSTLPLIPPFHHRTQRLHPRRVK